MIAATQPPLFKPSRAEQTYVIFMRVLSVVSIWYGLAYWLRLIGLEPGPGWRFDLMPMHWQVASVCLAVLYPFAAVGLWLPASWGPVIWFVCAASEFLMYVVFADLYGARYLIVLAHLLVAALYVAFRVTIHLQKKRSLALTNH